MGKCRVVFLLCCCLLPLLASAQLTILVEELPLNTPPEDTIFLAGSFNQWSPGDTAFRLQRDARGHHYIRLHGLEVPFEYKFTRGNWETVEGGIVSQLTGNRHYEGEMANDTLRLKIQSWEDLPPRPTYGMARLIVEEIPENTPPDAALYVVGSFNGWLPGDPAYRLERQENGQFTVEVPLWNDTTYYKFSRGSWETVEGRPNGRARVNRQLVVEEKGLHELRAEVESWEDLSSNPFNTYTFLLLLAAFQGLILILAINTLQDTNRAANRVLSLLILLLCIALVGRVSTYDREIFQRMPRLLILPDVIYFLYAPIFLAYINRLLRLPSQQSGWLFRWWYFAPFLAQLLAYAPLLMMPREDFILKVVNQEVKPFFAWAGGLALIYNTLFWFLCLRSIRRYEKESGDTHAFESNLQFLRVVMWLQAACLTLWAITYIIGAGGWVAGRDLSYITDKTTDAVWIMIALTVFLLGYFTMRQPEIFKLPAPESAPGQKPEEEDKAPPLSEEEMTAIKKKVEQAMEEEYPYRNPGLSLNELAEMTDTSPHTLSRVINEGFGVNFNDFVNSYRIEEFKRLAVLDDYKNHTLLAIAFIVGFNSKSAFNRSFKKLEDCTPREYLKRTAG